MKILLLILVLLLIPPSVFAHGGNDTPFEINGEEVLVNPAQITRNDLFDLPPDSDLGPKNYLVNQTLTFSIDTSELPYEDKEVHDANFIWDFGDGTKLNKKGATTYTYTYKKPGTYNLVVYSDYAGDGKQLVKSVLINVIPNLNYKLPIAKIAINGIELKENKLSLPLGKNNTFDGLSSSAASSKIVSYEWDFDDGSTSKEKTVTHKYKLPQYSASVALRVTDENGFYSDAVVNLTNNGSNEPSIFDNLGITKKLFAIIILGVLSSIFLVFILRKRLFNKS